MTMLSKQREICHRAIFSTKRLGETITYNGVSVVAIVEIGAEMIRGDWNDAATQIERAGLVDIATFTICKSDLTDKPEEGDWIVYDNEKYKVIDSIMYDSQMNAYVVQAMRNGTAYGGKTYRR